MGNTITSSLPKEECSIPIETGPWQTQEFPLHTAIRMGKLEEAELLVKENSDIDLSQKDKDGMTVWDHANLSENKASLELLLKIKFGSLWNRLISFFHSWFSESKEAGIQTLIQETETDYSKELQEPVHRAAFDGDLDVLKELVNPANINTQTVHGHTPLHLAALAGQKEAVQFLLKRGAQKDLLSNDRKSALHMAAIGDQKEIAKCLIQKGFNIDEQDSSGSTPLHFAMLKESFQTAPLLIQKGASLELANRYDLNPLSTCAHAMQIRCESRDPLNLPKEDQALFITIVLSKILHLIGATKNSRMLLDTYNLACRCVIGFQNANTPGRIGYFMSFVVAPMVAAGFYNLLGQPRSMGIIMNAVLGAGIIQSAWSAYSIAKRALQGLGAAWKQSRYEVYRPIRNAIIHAVNGSDSTVRGFNDAKDCYNLIQKWVNTGSHFDSKVSIEEEWKPSNEPLESPDKICSEFKMKGECLTSERLTPTNLGHAKWILGIDEVNCEKAGEAFLKESQAFYLGRCKKDEESLSICNQIYDSLSKSRQAICKASPIL